MQSAAKLVSCFQVGPAKQKGRPAKAALQCFGRRARARPNFNLNGIDMMVPWDQEQKSLGYFTPNLAKLRNHHDAAAENRTPGPAVPRRGTSTIVCNMPCLPLAVGRLQLRVLGPHLQHRRSEIVHHRLEPRHLRRGT